MPPVVAEGAEPGQHANTDEGFRGGAGTGMCGGGHAGHGRGNGKVTQYRIDQKLMPHLGGGAGLRGQEVAAVDLVPPLPQPEYQAGDDDADSPGTADQARYGGRWGAVGDAGTDADGHSEQRVAVDERDELLPRP